MSTNQHLAYAVIIIIAMSDSFELILREFTEILLLVLENKNQVILLVEAWRLLRRPPAETAQALARINSAVDEHCLGIGILLFICAFVYYFNRGLEVELLVSRGKYGAPCQV
jgi:hypothetical protein